MSQYSFSLPREFYRYIHFFGLHLTCKIVHSSQNNIAVEKLDFASLQHSFWLDLWSSEKAKYELLYHMLNIQIGVCACVCVCVDELTGQYILSLHFNADLLHCRFEARQLTTPHHITSHHTIISYRITMKIIMVKSWKREFDMKTLNQLNERHRIASTQIAQTERCVPNY